MGQPDGKALLRASLGVTDLVADLPISALGRLRAWAGGLEGKLDALLICASDSTQVRAVPA